jgi:4-diphosphocytidyl-2-C-methyl-D-erythritol kinase
MTVNEKWCVEAPAKINLWLRVLRRRDDGFHEIESRMVALDLADELEVELLRDGEGYVQLECDDVSLTVGADNLVVRAVREWELRRGRPLAGMKILLKKKIPHGAGLGGGSSDAAAILRAINDRQPDRLDEDVLLEVAGKIGSDVAFFLLGGPGDVSGRGEIVQRVQEAVPRLPVVLMKLPFPVPTPWAYQRWSQSQPLPPDLAEVPVLPWGEVRNDLERPVFEKYLVLAEMKSWLKKQPETVAALMSGSGSTMFAVVKDLSESANLIARAKEEFGDDLWTWAGWTRGG